MTPMHGDRLSSRRAGGWFRWLLAAGLVAGAVGVVPGALAAAAPPGAQAAENEPVVFEVAVPVRGRTQGEEEPILFAGVATIESTVIRAPGAPPVAEIAMDFSAVTARGETSGMAYQVDNPMGQQRRLSQTQTIEVSFPYYREADPLSARSATASLQLNAAGKPLRLIVIDAVGDDDRLAGQE